jgi:hypothetical protein
VSGDVVIRSGLLDALLLIATHPAAPPPRQP